MEMLFRDRSVIDFNFIQDRLTESVFGIDRRIFNIMGDRSTLIAIELSALSPSVRQA